MTPRGQNWRRSAYAVPLVCGGVFGIYVAVQFFDSDLPSMLLGALLGLIISIPFGLLLGWLAAAAGRGVLNTAHKRPVPPNVQQWRILFSSVTSLTIAVAAAIGATAAQVSGLGFLSIAVIAAIAFISAYLYFPESELADR